MKGTIVEDNKGPETLEELAALRMQDRVLKYLIDGKGCWIHTNIPGPKGYVLLTSVEDKTSYKAHRLSYILHNGSIPDGKQVNHVCDVTNCINPDHLYAGTQGDNLNDAYRRGRRKYSAITDDDIGFIVVLRDKGYTQTEIAKLLGIPQSSISRHLRKVS